MITMFDWKKRGVSRIIVTVVSSMSALTWFFNFILHNLLLLSNFVFFAQLSNCLLQTDRVRPFVARCAWGPVLEVSPQQKCFEEEVKEQTCWIESYTVPPYRRTYSCKLSQKLSTSDALRTRVFRSLALGSFLCDFVWTMFQNKEDKITQFQFSDALWQFPLLIPDTFIDILFYFKAVLRKKLAEAVQKASHAMWKVKE